MPQTLKQILGRRGMLLLWLERLLLAVGLICLGVVAFAVIDARWFAYRQGRRLDEVIRARAARAGANPGGGVATTAPGGAPPASETDRLDSFRPGAARTAPPVAPPAAPPAEEGSVLGRVEIPRVGISALVLEGVSGSTLRHGVGHIPGTALPAPAGNIGLAGHRDSVFRGLKDIKKGDLIDLETLDGVFRYGVEWAQIVEPNDVAVLAASNRPELTLVTCYPFYYVGSAPERFVVRAHLLGADGQAGAGPVVPAPVR